MCDGGGAVDQAPNLAVEELGQTSKPCPVLGEAIHQLQTSHDPQHQYLTKKAMIIYRGDGRGPDLTVELEGFDGFHSRDNPFITTSGESQRMVGGSKDCTLPTRYKGFMKVNFEAPQGMSKKDAMDRFCPTIYALFVPPGQAIDTHQYLLDKRENGTLGQGSANVGSQEVTALEVPLDHVLGYRTINTKDPGPYVGAIDLSDSQLEEMGLDHAQIEEFTKFKTIQSLQHTGEM